MLRINGRDYTERERRIIYPFREKIFTIVIGYAIGALILIGVGIFMSIGQWILHENTREGVNFFWMIPGGVVAGIGLIYLIGPWLVLVTLPFAFRGLRGDLTLPKEIEDKYLEKIRIADEKEAAKTPEKVRKSVA
jgi:hypothetical protein|tara:strand:+ start:16220 stop:16624 length:405 start_codon:yes stop_codon:yes gene_type:complete